MTARRRGMRYSTIEQGRRAIAPGWRGGAELAQRDPQGAQAFRRCERKRFMLLYPASGPRSRNRRVLLWVMTISLARLSSRIRQYGRQPLLFVPAILLVGPSRKYTANRAYRVSRCSTTLTTYRLSEQNRNHSS